MENPELFSSSSPASQALSRLLHSRLYPTATVPHWDREFLQLLPPQREINGTRQSVTVYQMPFATQVIVAHSDDVD